MPATKNAEVKKINIFDLPVDEDVVEVIINDGFSALDKEKLLEIAESLELNVPHNI